MRTSIPPFKKRRAAKPNWRALMLLFLFFSTILTIIFFQSPLSRIQKVEIEGNDLLSDRDVLVLSQIRIGQTYYLNVRPNDIAKRIKTSPLIEKVTVSKTFPSLISIRLDEAKPLAIVNNGNGQMAYLMSTGRQVLMEKIDKLFLGPVVSHLNNQQLSELADVLKNLPPGVLASLSQIVDDPLSGELVIYTREQYEIHTTWENLGSNLSVYPELVAALAKQSADGQPIKGKIFLKAAKWFVPYQEEQTALAENG